MVVIKSDLIVYCDIDQTLVDWNVKDGDSFIEIENNGITSRFVPITENIEQIKKHRVCGHGIAFWSLGGWAWANLVIKALGLEQYADVVLSKPRWFIDDLPSSEFMPEINRINKSKR